MCSVLVVFFIDLDNTILDETLLEDHAFFLDIFVCLEAFHYHMVGKTRVGIVNKHLNKMTFWEGARDSGGESLPSF